MKASNVIYADLKYLLRKIQGCQLAAKRRKLHSKNRDALAMQVRVQNCQKRGKLLGPAQYSGEDVVYVLLSNILEEEGRMQAYMGKKSRH